MGPTLDRTVLLVAQQPGLRRQLRVLLGRHGGRLVECRRAGEIDEPLSLQQPDLILLDVSGRDADATEATLSIRARSSLPLIALVAAKDELQGFAALDAGADDCVALPFGSNEMLARMGAALDGTQRSGTRASPDAVRVGVLDVDLLSRAVRLRGKPVHVTPTEYKLLRVLLESAGRVVSRERLSSEVWGSAAIDGGHRLRAHMNQLQRKFERSQPLTLRLIAEPAGGYRMWVRV